VTLANAVCQGSIVAGGATSLTNTAPDCPVQSNAPTAAPQLEPSQTRPASHENAAQQASPLAPQGALPPPPELDELEVSAVVVLVVEPPFETPDPSPPAPPAPVSDEAPHPTIPTSAVVTQKNFMASMVANWRGRGIVVRQPLRAVLGIGIVAGEPSV